MCAALLAKFSKQILRRKDFQVCRLKEARERGMEDGRDRRGVREEGRDREREGLRRGGMEKEGKA